MILLLSLAFAQQKPGIISVDAGNAKGEIILDGFPTGMVAPTQLESVPPGEHELEVEYGCMKGSMRVTVKPEETVVATMPMSNVGGTGHMRIKELPYGADVMIDDAPVSRTEEGVEVKCGARRVHVEAPGYASFDEVVIITTGKWASVDVVMEESALDGGGRHDDRPPERAPQPRYEDPEEEEFFDDEYDSLDEPEPEPEPERRRPEPEPEPVEDFDEFDELDDFGEDDDLDDLDDYDEDDFDEDDDLDDLDDSDEDDDFDEDEDDFLDDGLDDLDDDIGRGDRGNDRDDRGNDREPREPSNFPTRIVATGAGGAVAVAGVVYTGVNQRNLGYELEVNKFYVTANQLEQASLHNIQTVEPLKQKRNLGVGITIAGAVVAGASYALIPSNNADVMVVPTEDGGTLLISGSF